MHIIPYIPISYYPISLILISLFAIPYLCDYFLKNIKKTVLGLGLLLGPWEISKHHACKVLWIEFEALQIAFLYTNHRGKEECQD